MLRGWVTARSASCLPLLFAALTGRSGHGLAQNLAKTRKLRTIRSASCLPLLFAALTGRSGHGLAQNLAKTRKLRTIRSASSLPLLFAALTGRSGHGLARSASQPVATRRARDRKAITNVTTPSPAMAAIPLPREAASQPSDISDRIASSR